MFKKIKYILIGILTISMLFSAKCFAEDMSVEWKESKTVVLSKVTYNSNTHKMTVHINEKAKKLAHEYELYLLSEDELIEAMGSFIYNNKNLYILAIMTVDVSDTSRVIDKGNGDFIIQDQDMYFANNNPNIVGKKIYVGVESLDEEYNSSYSNLLEMTVNEGDNEIVINNNQKGNDNSPNSSNNNKGLLIGGAIGVAAIGGGTYYFLKKRKLSRREKRKLKNKKSFKPSIENKSIVIFSANEELVKTLKKKPYLKVTSVSYDEIENSVKENKPDLLISDLINKETFIDLLNKKENSLKECEVGLIVRDDVLPQNKDELDKAINDKKIMAYVPYSTSVYKTLVKLVLPILKPKFDSDESLDNIGQIADLLGIPAISTIINVYTSGRDIKENLEESELGVNESASIIGDIASILGLDKLQEVMGLVGNVESIKEAFNKEAGANEKKGAIEGAKDIVDTIKDISNK